MRCGSSVTECGSADGRRLRLRRPDGVRAAAGRDRRRTCTRDRALRRTVEATRGPSRARRRRRDDARDSRCRNRPRPRRDCAGASCGNNASRQPHGAQRPSRRVAVCVARSTSVDMKRQSNRGVVRDEHVALERRRAADRRPRRNAARFAPSPHVMFVSARDRWAESAARD